MSADSWKLAAVVLALFLLLFCGLTTSGVVGPDEPRYASIGREMARSGDWITPRLWGEAWFEKPPLLYWMIGLANLAGLGPDLAPRLPVALLSLAFLLVYHRMLRAEFGPRPALIATAVLGTSAGWVAFSHVGVTDLPMSAALGVGMLLGLRWLSTGDARYLRAAGVFFGIAVLAKGLVPLVLSLPLVWGGRKRWKSTVWLLPLVFFLLTAAPWYILCGLRNGPEFVQDLFWRHHVDRFAGSADLHQRPPWFYVPVLIAGLFPWSPALIGFFRKVSFKDPRRRFLLLWAGFGFLFFSLSAGKLPGYLLPLFPAMAALAGLALDEMRNVRWLLAACAAMLMFIPVVAFTLPHALAEGLSSARTGGWNWYFVAASLLVAAGVVWLERMRGRGTAIALLFASAVVGVAYVKVRGLPEMDRLYSARGLWRQVAGRAKPACVTDLDRNWRYGLNYYSVTPLPECEQTPTPVRIVQLPGQPPTMD